MNKSKAMTNDEAEAFMERFQREMQEVRVDDAVIESHQIEALMAALQNEEDYKVLEKICV
jgi:flagellar motor switch protein FliG